MKTELVIDFNKIPEELSILDYIVLCIVHQDKDTVEELILTEKIDNNVMDLAAVLENLVNFMFIKIINEEDEFRIELRKKTTDLFPETNNIQFVEFWDKYHSIIKEWAKTDRFASEKVWKRMTIKERQLALDNIQPYYDSAKIIRGRKVVHKARTYLNNKLYNDEFDCEYDETWTKNHI